jgi:hypothetical protein
LDWKWNADGIRLGTLRQFFEARGFDLHKENVEIRVDEEGNWDFFNKPKPVPEPEPEMVVETEDVKEEVEARPKHPGRLPKCKKCGEKHWRFQKCTIKEE